MRALTIDGTKMFNICLDFWNSFCFLKLMTKLIFFVVSSQYAYRIRISKKSRIFNILKYDSTVYQKVSPS